MGPAPASAGFFIYVTRPAPRRDQPPPRPGLSRFGISRLATAGESNLPTMMIRRVVGAVSQAFAPDIDAASSPPAPPPRRVSRRPPSAGPAISDRPLAGDHGLWIHHS